MKQLFFALALLIASPSYALIDVGNPSTHPSLVCFDNSTEVRVYEGTLTNSDMRMEVEQFQGQTPEVLFRGQVKALTERGHALYQSTHASLFVLDSEQGLRGVLNLDGKSPMISRMLECTTIYHIMPIGDVSPL